MFWYLITFGLGWIGGYYSFALKKPKKPGYREQRYCILCKNISGWGVWDPATDACVCIYCAEAKRTAASVMCRACGRGHRPVKDEFGFWVHKWGDEGTGRVCLAAPIHSCVGLQQFGMDHCEGY
jgi:hypothetical protein